MQISSRRALLQLGMVGTASLALGKHALAAGPRTLLDLAGEHPAAPRLSDATLVIIDAQGEYRHGPLALHGIEPAMLRLSGLLARARSAGTPIIHVAHRGEPGDFFDRAAPRGQFLPEAMPLGDEIIVEKTLPNAFARTDLQDRLTAIGRKDLIMVGFMTHMCVSSSVRAAYDLDYRVTVAADATATRALPAAPAGKPVSAEQLQAAALAALADNFALIVTSAAL